MVGADLAELVRRHQGGLRSYLRWLGATAAETDELAQDAFVAWFTHAGAAPGVAAAGAWLRTVARNLLLRRRRSEGRRGCGVPLDEAAVAWERHLGADDAESFRAALRACLQQLSARQAEAVRLRYGEDLEIAAVGKAMGIKSAGAETLLKRTRQLLRECIERRLR